MKKRLSMLPALWNKKKYRPWAGIFIFALVVLFFFFWRLGSFNAIIMRPGGRVSDLLVTFWPNIKYIKNTWQAFGTFPLWRTLIFSGSPFHVDPQSGLWYLPNLVHLFFPIAVGFNFLLIFHIIVGGIGMWIWVRTSGSSRKAGWISAVAFAFTPSIYAHLGFGHIGLA